MNEEQIAYVKKELARGVSEAAVRQALADGGYQPTHIHQLMQAAKGGVKQATAQSAVAPATGISVWLIVVVVGCCVAVAVFAAWFYYFMAPEESVLVEEVPPTSMDDETDGDQRNAFTFAKVLENEKSYHCEFVKQVDGGVEESVAYVDSQQQLLYFESQAASSTQKEYSIVTSDMFYIWSETATGSVGVAVSVEDNNQRSEALFEILGADIIDHNTENVSFSCKEWDVDAAIFQPPSDLEYIDYSAYME